MKRISLILFLLAHVSLFAQTTIDNFTLPNVVDDAPVALDGCQGCIAVAIIFTSVTCPYDQYYTARNNNLVNNYKGKIQFLLINSWPEPEESIEKMKIAHSSGGLLVPYLADKDQLLMRALGAKRSPEVFLIKKANNQFVVKYSGALDDNPQVANAVTQRYLALAIDNLLGGKPIDLPATRTVGCSIRKK
jgi:hypothetical protein